MAMGYKNSWAESHGTAKILSTNEWHNKTKVGELLRFYYSYVIFSWWKSVRGKLFRELGVNRKGRISITAVVSSVVE